MFVFFSLEVMMADSMEMCAKVNSAVSHIVKKGFLELESIIGFSNMKVFCGTE